MKEINEKLQKFGQSQNGNFYVCDTIGVPHPYCITPRHVAVASDHFSGMLGEEAIKKAEFLGAHCGMRGCNLSYKEHKQALLVACKADLKIEDKINPELERYLIDSKAAAVAEDYAGFAFIEEKVWLKED